MFEKAHDVVSYDHKVQGDFHSGKIPGIEIAKAEVFLEFIGTRIAHVYLQRPPLWVFFKGNLLNLIKQAGKDTLCSLI